MKKTEIVQLIKNHGYWIGFVVGTFKIAMALISRSWLLGIHAVYSIIKSAAMRYALHTRATNHRAMFGSGLLVVAASAVYLVYSMWIFFFGSDSSYHQYIAIGIAAVTVYELSIAIHGLCQARKQKDAQRETMKYINLASALISVSLTQTAILSFTHKGYDMSGAYAIGDAVFGFLALIVGLIMLLRARQLKGFFSSCADKQG